MVRIACVIAGATAFLLAGVPASYALSGDAPWCAVVEIGSGEVEWDCHYQTVEQCAPNVVAGNRGFCNLNPYYVPRPAAPLAHARHYRQQRWHHN
ncbi:MAG TPA: DUF3551 domain-containing protein [Xanthobacteraceae bacterium]|jgi:Protein of unknown function (DUF3551)|nr:DUF3551 domain-containing protein [Xanthobacteraceae bacterium]